MKEHLGNHLKRTLKHKTLLMLFWGIVTLSKSFGQSSPEALGQDFFNALKSTDSTEMLKLIPEPQFLIAYTKHIGMERTEEEIAEFLEKYPQEVEQYLDRLNKLKEQGVKWGIAWEQAALVEVKKHMWEQELNEGGASVLVMELSVIFKYKTTTYKLLLVPVLQHDAIWFIADNRPRLEKS